MRCRPPPVTAGDGDATAALLLLLLLPLLLLAPEGGVLHVHCSAAMAQLVSVQAPAAGAATTVIAGEVVDLQVLQRTHFCSGTKIDRQATKTKGVTPGFESWGPTQWHKTRCNN